MGSTRIEDLILVVAPSDRPHAQPWRRVAARLIDVLTVACVLWVLVITQFFWFMDRLSDRFHPEPWGRGFVATVSFAVMSFVYEAVFLVRSKGQTPGRDIMKVRVIPKSRTDHVAWEQAIRRALLPAVAVMAPPLWGPVGVACLLGATILLPTRRAVPDLVAATVVVPYDRDREDPTAGRRAKGWRRQRLLERRMTGMPDDGRDVDDYQPVR